MKVSELKVGDEVEIKLSHWNEPMTALVEAQGKKHCQMHGEFIDNVYTFRKIKKSGAKSYMFDLEFNTEPELLRVIA